MTIHQDAMPPVGHLRPRITLKPTEYERLSRLSHAAMNTMPEEASFLASELDRAHVPTTGIHPTDAVCMGCEVAFRDDTTGKVRIVTLVYPGEADIAQDKISILTPIGAALIGVRVGKAITWETRTGEVRKLTILGVRTPELV